MVQELCLDNFPLHLLHAARFAWVLKVPTVCLFLLPAFEQWVMPDGTHLRDKNSVEQQGINMWHVSSKLQRNWHLFYFDHIPHQHIIEVRTCSFLKCNIQCITTPGNHAPLIQSSGLYVVVVLRWNALCLDQWHLQISWLKKSLRLSRSLLLFGRECSVLTWQHHLKQGVICQCMEGYMCLECNSCVYMG